MIAFPGHLTWTQSARMSAAKSVLYVVRQATDPYGKKTIFVSVIQPDLEYAASATIPFMPTDQQDRLLALCRKAVQCMAGVQPQDDVLLLIRNLKLTHVTHR